MRFFVSALAFAMLMVNRVLGQAEEQSPADFSSEMGPALLKLVGALVLILVIIYGSVWLLKRFSGGRNVGNGNSITVLERHFLAPKQALYLIRVGSRHLLLGGSESGLRHLTDLQAEDFAEPAKGAVAPAEDSKFNKVLKQARQTFMPLLRSREATTESGQ
jgi:flagellar biosynthetic protein FliO